MIKIKNTENLTGVTISGDYNDLYSLFDTFHEIVIGEESEKHRCYIEMSIRVLGLCYDVRHSFQGDRDVELVDNNMNEEKMKWHSIITPKSNVYYKCNYLYPEMFFIMLALNELLELRIRDLTKSKYILKEALDKNVVWDDKIAIIRVFQAEFVKCVKEVLAEASFNRWLKVMNEDYLNIQNIAGQFVDVVNIKYINMSKEKRLKNLSSIAKRIAEYRYDKEHNEIKDLVEAAAKEYGCLQGDIRLKGIDYPEDIVW